MEPERRFPEGAVDIGVTSRAGKTPERVAGAVAREIGKAPLVFATSNQNAAANITTQDLVKIYSGKKINWPNGERLRLILRPETDSDTALSLNGKTASAKNIADGSYPLFKTFCLLTIPEPAAPVRRFVDFIFSPATRKILASLGFWLEEAKAGP